MLILHPVDHRVETLIDLRGGRRNRLPLAARGFLLIRHPAFQINRKSPTAADQKTKDLRGAVRAVSVSDSRKDKTAAMIVLQRKRAVQSMVQSCARSGVVSAVAHESGVKRRVGSAGGFWRDEIALDAAERDDCGKHKAKAVSQPRRH